MICVTRALQTPSNCAIAAWLRTAPERIKPWQWWAKANTRATRGARSGGAGAPHLPDSLAPRAGRETDLHHQFALRGATPPARAPTDRPADTSFQSRFGPLGVDAPWPRLEAVDGAPIIHDRQLVPGPARRARLYRWARAIAERGRSRGGVLA